MSRKIDVRRILDEKSKGLSNNEIARQWHISRHSVGHVVRKGVELGLLPDGPLPEMDDDSLLPVRTQGLVHSAWSFDSMRKHPQPHLFRTLQSRLQGLQHEGVLFIPEAPHLGGAQVVTGTGALHENAGAFW